MLNVGLSGIDFDPTLNSDKLMLNSLETASPVTTSPLAHLKSGMPASIDHPFNTQNVTPKVKTSLSTHQRNRRM